MSSLESNLFTHLAEMAHEQVVYFHCKDTDLKAIVAIHDTTLGPALGGTRVWEYSSEAEALNDVLRLSRGMTYKSSISGINLGGGKAVILADKNTPRDEFFWRRYGKFVDKLSGKYITAEDVGTSTKEIEYISLETKHVSGKPIYLGGGGDPSPFTAYGVYLAMKASWKKLTASESLEGIKIAVQGAGHVGQYLIDHLIAEGALVQVADINPINLKTVANKHKVTIIDPKDIISTEADIYAPCALGATLNPTTIPTLKCRVVCGAANNQLLDEVRDGDELLKKGILYAPDFLINAGGVINCFSEVSGNYSKEKTMGLTDMIYNRVLEIYQLSEKEHINSQEAALKIAKERIEKAKNLNAKW